MPATSSKKNKVTFITAARKEGYLKKGGGFKPLPQKGSGEYKKIVRHV